MGGERGEGFFVVLGTLYSVKAFVQATKTKVYNSFRFLGLMDVESGCAHVQQVMIFGWQGCSVAKCIVLMLLHKSIYGAKEKT